MNLFIPSLIRVQYALNCAESFNHRNEMCQGTAHDTKEASYMQELELPLSVTIGGKPRAVNGDYLAKVFEDIGAKTGEYINELNLRKRIMGALKDVGNYKPMKAYREMLARYCGSTSWEALNRDAEKMYEAKLNELKNMQTKKAMSSAEAGCMKSGKRMKVMTEKGTVMVMEMTADGLFRMVEEYEAAETYSIVSKEEQMKKQMAEANRTAMILKARENAKKRMREELRKKVA